MSNSARDLVTLDPVKRDLMTRDPVTRDTVTRDPVTRDPVTRAKEIHMIAIEIVICWSLANCDCDIVP